MKTKKAHARGTDLGLDGIRNMVIPASTTCVGGVDSAPRDRKGFDPPESEIAFSFDEPSEDSVVRLL